MPNEEDRNRLIHILQAAKEAVGYASGRTRQDLDSDRQLVHSLVRCIEIAGEAAARISQQCKNETPQIQWDDMIGMRNRLIHAYFDINLNIVWRTVKDELPKLIEEVETIIEEGKSSGN